jgi:chromosome partitioning protein
MDTVREVQEDHNRDLRVAGIVVNQFLARAKLPQRLVDELRRDGLPVLEPFLSSSVKIRESHQASRPMPFFARSHKLSAQFERLYDAVENA